MEDEENNIKIVHTEAVKCMDQQQTLSSKYMNTYAGPRSILTGLILGCLEPYAISRHHSFLRSRLSTHRKASGQVQLRTSAL